MKLLVLMPTKYVGNFVISLRTLEACLDENGRSETTIVVGEQFEPLARAVLGPEAHFIVFPRGKARRLRRIVRFFEALRHDRYDQILDLDGTVVSGRIARFARGREKSGPAFAKRPGPYNRLIDIDRDTQHCFDDYVQLAASAGIAVTDRRYRLFPPLTDVTPPVAALPEKRTVCIHPSATKDYKQWDIDRFAALADRFVERDWQVIVVGAGAGEAARVRHMLDAMHGEAINAHNRLSLIELVRLVQTSQLYIGNDSGPMHLAAATGIPVLALFGPTELIRWRPRAPLSRVMKGASACAPACQPEACLQQYQCMTSLDVDQVIDEVREMIGDDAI